MTLSSIQNSEEFLGHDSSLTNCILSSGSSGLIIRTQACGSNSSEGVTGNWADRRIEASCIEENSEQEVGQLPTK